MAPAAWLEFTAAELDDLIGAIQAVAHEWGSHPSQEKTEERLRITLAALQAQCGHEWRRWFLDGSRERCELCRAFRERVAAKASA